MMDKIKALTVFRRVIELGSFKAAAEDLLLSKAAISKNINQLEDYLQAPLIHRTTRKMHVTEKGKQYYHQVRNILDELNTADLSIIESSNQLRGLIKVSVPMSAGLLLINPAVCEFMKEHPEISVELLMSDQYLDLVEQGLDVAIRGGGPLKSSSLKSRKIHGLDLVLCASAEYVDIHGQPSEPESLYTHNCLMYSLALSPRQWVFRQDNEVRTIDLPPSSYVVNNGLALKQAARAGLGILLTPKLFVAKELQTGELVKLMPDWQAEKHALYAVYPFHKEQSKNVRTFIDFIIKYVTKNCENA
ncbi:LysR family transcriptional regulator [Thalassotalea sp. PP2-459]|uniref:LysR family transcriptional regulator n=1 Tax=Thalassotalea sp. PP2-459 TaxID=1742724 RepID=UPI0020C995AB|nr:LysR family transcriptional regulator [Thalassotalea sp. PP2-459]